MVRPVVSVAAEDIYAGLGPWAEADGEETGWALLHLCEALTWQGLQPIYTYALPDPDGNLGWSILFDVDRIPAEAMGYLAQYIGVALPAGNDRAQNQDLIVNRPGWKRGRPDTITSAVQTTLTGSKRITLLERDTSAYHATIQTYSHQTPDPAATEAVIADVKPGGLIRQPQRRTPLRQGRHSIRRSLMSLTTSHEE
jgi:hypothetical protein